MLISLSHKFIFVANLKAGSTSIEKALRPYCEICLDRSEWGKHVSLSHVELRFARIFEIVPRSEFRVLAVIREPLDWLHSLYRSHKSVQFEGSRLDTSGMSMTEFLTCWCSEHSNQCLPQIEVMRDIADRFGVDYLMRYERLAEDFDDIVVKMGLLPLDLPRENVSVDISEEFVIDPALYARVRTFYAADIDVWQRLGGRLLTKEDKESALQFATKTDNKLNINREIEISSEIPAVFPADRNSKTWKTRQINRDDVFWAFRMLLGRDPESDAVVDEHRSVGTHDALRHRIMQSEEFALRIGEASDLLKVPDKTLVLPAEVATDLRVSKRRLRKRDPI